MLYKSGLEASWNPGMSEPSAAVMKALRVEPARAFGSGGGLYNVKGLSGIDGLSFAYRLQQWGPRVGPSMLPADSFGAAYVPSGLGSPVSWMLEKLGLTSTGDLLKDALTVLNGASDTLAPLSTKIVTFLTQARSYASSTDAGIQAKSQAAQNKGAGLTASLSTLQSSLSHLITTVKNAQYDASTSKDVAQDLKENADAFADQVSDFAGAVDSFESDVKNLQKTAASGPSSIQNALIGSVTHSVSTLTWIAGGAAAVYFLAPSLIPRLIGGIKKGIRS